MKPQDILFLGFLALLLYLRKPQLFIASGLSLIVLSIPLFYLQIFFTAQRLVMYASFFIFLGILSILYKERNAK